MDKRLPNLNSFVELKLDIVKHAYGINLLPNLELAVGECHNGSTKVHRWQWLTLMNWSMYVIEALLEVQDDEHEPPTETFTDDFINLHIIFIKHSENHIVKLTQYTNQIPKLPLPHINLWMTIMQLSIISTIKVTVSQQLIYRGKSNRPRKDPYGTHTTPYPSQVVHFSTKFFAAYPKCNHEVTRCSLKYILEHEMIKWKIQQYSSSIFTTI